MGRYVPRKEEVKGLYAVEGVKISGLVLLGRSCALYCVTAVVCVIMIGRAIFIELVHTCVALDSTRCWFSFAVATGM